MMDDNALLRRYAEEHAEEAFTELVERHIDLVYSAALRQLNGDAHLAADAAQLVFSDLARKAKSLAGHRLLAGWLFTSTRYAARNLVRGERRRHAREQQAFQLETMNRDDDSPPLDWQRVRPVLDDALGELNESERDAILMRFFGGRDYASVGAKFNVNDNTARMRVDRALDKLRTLLERRGITSTSAALATALASQSVLAAPAGLAATVAGAAMAGATGTVAVATFMSVTKMQIGIAAALSVAAVTGYVMQAERDTARREEMARLQRETAKIVELRNENRQLARSIAEADDLRRAAASLTQLREEAVSLKAQAPALRTVAPAPERRPPARASFSGELFEAAQLDRTPKPTFQARPVYPTELRQAGITGLVDVDFVVDASGAVKNPTAVRSTEPRLEAAAIAAVSQWKFDPGFKGGRAINTHLQMPIVFTLTKDEPGTPAANNNPRPAAPTAPWF